MTAWPPDGPAARPPDGPAARPHGARMVVTALRGRASRTVAPRGSRIVAVAIAALACLAPVPGDIGACGQPVQRLDEPTFFKAKQTVDCRRCEECGIPTNTCYLACGRDAPPVASFPPNCSPLVHDGEVCLRALLEASCDDYAGYVADDGATAPTECNFCPPGGAR